MLANTKGKLEIALIQRGITYTIASAGEVVCHWAKRGRGTSSRPPRDAAVLRAGRNLDETGRKRGTMNHITGRQLDRIPEGMKWCPQCNGYGSPLREESPRCTRCGGSGLVWADRERPVAGGGKPSAGV